MVSTPGYVSGSLLKTILEVAESNGVLRDTMLNLLSLSEKALREVELRVPVDDVIKLFDLVIAQSGNQSFGLEVGQNIKPGSLNALGYALMSAPNMLEALKIQKEFGGIISNSAELKIDLGKKFVTIAYTISHEMADRVRPLNDMFISMFWNYANWITRTTGKLAKLTFSHPEPSYVEVYEDLFGLKPDFGETECRILFEKKYLMDPLYQADESLNSLMTEKTKALHHKSRSEISVYAAVAHQVRRLMPIQKATLTSVAHSLNMSERSLSRKLKDEGYSFKSVLIGVRETLALEYLKDLNQSVTEIANKLGYRDYSAFSHAFRSWTGHSPTDYREEIEKSQQR